MTAALSLPIRAVFFDAVGTLIHPDPAAGEVYHQVGQRFGSRLQRADVLQRFKTAFAAQEQRDAWRDGRTSEKRELERWRAIVEACLPDVVDGDKCFRSLHEHFARPDAWAVQPGAGDVLAKLQVRRVGLGLCSNFDHRLRTVLAGLPELRPIQWVAISSEVGWRKPAAAFYAAVARCAQLAPEQILVVGDDRDNDYLGARQAGMQAVLFDPRQRPGEPGDRRITRLDELFSLLDD
jgi:putative hydrolase of the HAD superfamily